MTLTALKTYRLCVACKTLKNVSLVVAARWVRQADKKILMNETEYEIYLSLPDSFTVYCGVSTGRNPDGMSWTQDLEKTEWFSRRYGTGYVLEGLAQKKDVLAFFDRRGEKEIVISAKWRGSAFRPNPFLRL